MGSWGSSGTGSQLARRRTEQRSPLVSQVHSCRENFPRIVNADDENRDKSINCSWSHHIVLTTLIAVILIGTIATVTFSRTISLAHLIQTPKTATLHPPDPLDQQPPSWSKLRVFRRGAVCVDGQQCAVTGRSIIKRNGSAVDAAIAAMICNGLINMQSMGFGGGFLMTIYQRSSQQAATLDARECAPRAADSDTYNGHPALASQIGPLAIPVPGELAGYWTVHQRFGRLPWAELFEPSIKICEAGYNLTKVQYDSLGMNSEAIYTDPSLRSWFVDEKTGAFQPPGTIIRPTKLCETMRLIAATNATEFYNGSLGRLFIEDIRRRGSILDQEDLAMYRAKWISPITTRLSTGETLYTIGPPGSGSILAFILNVLDGYDFSPSSMATPQATLTTHHRIIEAFKYAYALRTELADPTYVDLSTLLHNLTSRNFADEVRRRINDHRTSNDPRHYGEHAPGNNGDHGTAHVAILAPDGDAVSVTSSVNLYFGSGVVSERTGILTSSSMDDFGVSSRRSYFGLPASHNNRIEPGKRPLSSMSPSIIVDAHGDVRMVVGAAGGTKITTAVAYMFLTVQVIARHLWIKETIKEAVDAARIHHQLIPMEVSYEYGVPKSLVDGLHAMGHETSRYRDRGSVVCAIVRVNGTVYANADYRKGGEVYGID
ncbi:glutathione hydrolase 1 proenzyme isoform X1 [Neodiprion lecontei]|uniref:Glutathione hydrolase 1 proenzyme isoform X1 n=1 Tax=Neodiprion lecontei TaxID=441921 RepID=A0ABM3G5E2_NEOLC|nr:glutathione hydrolase 1 proenzyme isoform X1 [Neodiprion lecontei]XP_046595490.1 glutathione hydrolase 1 proenzyme isoform X1 [Neodiprion lecontei]XP_046595491.1 glutathione hydrolase 1 proenzyme isoform X1 [Neodiprion lecontei]XP_046595492.1 glutathione hydrolase 1 proenzyme isoform X1 [Neodiprion lecontei]XP_046595493.1 glutathione hydrolase 1 proenzyme isoform X1 [Neodiprion lecontei]XP_046595495.1 glutathione hydrolase 1 proenzyme isoform X1 [Neodiprion lecontei]